MISKQAWVTLGIGLALAGCGPEPTVDASPAQVREVEAWLSAEYPGYRYDIEMAWIETDDHDKEVICAFLDFADPATPSSKDDENIGLSQLMYYPALRQGVAFRYERLDEAVAISPQRWMSTQDQHFEFKDMWEKTCLD